MHYAHSTLSKLRSLIYEPEFEAKDASRISPTKMLCICYANICLFVAGSNLNSLAFMNIIG